MSKTQVRKLMRFRARDKEIRACTQVKSLEIPPIEYGRAKEDIGGTRDIDHQCSDARTICAHGILDRIGIIMDNLEKWTQNIKAILEPPCMHNWNNFYDVGTHNIASQTTLQGSYATCQGGLCTSSAMQTPREFPPIHLDPGGSSSAPLTCEVNTQYDKLHLDCIAACARLNEALGTAISSFPCGRLSWDEEAWQFRRRVCKAYDVLIDVRDQLRTYRSQRRSDATAQTELPRVLRFSVPAA